MRIIHVNYHETVSGAGIAAERLASAQRKHDMEVESYYFYSKVRSRRLPMRIRFNIILFRKIETILNFCFYRPQSRGGSFNFFKTGLAQWINKKNPDIVHLHWVCRNLVSLKEIGMMKPSVVWTCHDTWGFGSSRYYPSKEKLPHWLEKCFLKRWGELIKNEKRIQFVAPSQWIKSEIIELDENLTPDRVWVISGILNEDYMKDASPVRAVRPLRFSFVSAMGIEDDRKGWRTIEMALRSLSQCPSIPSIVVEIVGRNPVKTVWFENIELKFVGELSESEMINHYDRCHGLLFASLQDNLPNVLIEGMARGCIPIASNVGGVPEIVEDSVSGHLFPSNDPEKLFEILNRFIKDEQERSVMAGEAIKRINDCFSQAQAIEKISSLYQTVISNDRKNS